MKLAWILSGLLAMSALVTTNPAEACSRKIKNGTPHKIWVAYAFWRRDSSWFCSGGVTCSNSKTRVVGWFEIKPNESATVTTHDPSELNEWYYAFSEAGHTWSDNSNWGLCLTSQPHNFCANTNSYAPSTCASGERSVSFRWLSYYDPDCDTICLGSATYTLII